ncbi:hypothetical protein [Bacillus benzoevorans]|uniref:Uncharacterized protein n=1 Tax=Bacillus benzoevorans TaxID=1456 RepID=A0A7X0HU61_9BACI|nr:hypothetical protein [Bacillus benzoevorans]MBB6446866.1 hypothetical protein [Bacillus benzoevorans]
MEKLYDLWFVNYEHDMSSVCDKGIPESEIDERIRQMQEIYSAEGFDIVAAPSQL